MVKPTNILREWYERYVSDPQVVILAVLLVVGFAVMLAFGKMLAPVLAGVVIAYLLDGLVEKCTRMGAPRMSSVVLVFILFMTVFVFVMLWLIPQLSYQLTQLVQELPKMIVKGHELLLTLPEKYPNLFTEAQVGDLIAELRADITAWGQRVLSLSLPAVFGLMSIMVYLILVPLLVFFFMKDKQTIIQWLTAYLPDNRVLLTVVWRDVDRQIGNYVRGKFIEILIIWMVCLLTFVWFGLNFAMLLAVLVGLSVIIPYIGAAVVTIPVAAVAYFQWGLSSDFYWVIAAYLVIQALDGNALVPLLFSEVVNLHPIAIIVAILVFGGLWGFWGVFFAIPLATVVQAVLKAWPDRAAVANA